MEKTTRNKNSKSSLDKITEFFSNLVWLIITIIVLLLFAYGIIKWYAEINTIESSYRCYGKIAYKENTAPIEVYFELVEYKKPWIFWSDSDGSINLEVPNLGIFKYYSHVEQIGNKLFIYDTYPSKKLQGGFFKLSKTLSLNLPYGGFYDGTCNTQE